MPFSSFFPYFQSHVDRIWWAWGILDLFSLSLSYFVGEGIDWGSEIGFYVAQASLKFAKHPYITLKWFMRCWWSRVELFACKERILPMGLHPQPLHLCILHPLPHHLDLKLRYCNRALNCFSCLFLLGMWTLNRHTVFVHNQTDISCETKPQLLCLPSSLLRLFCFAT